jgi:hypothetical protein
MRCTLSVFLYLAVFNDFQPDTRSEHVEADHEVMRLDPSFESNCAILVFEDFGERILTAFAVEDLVLISSMRIRESRYFVLGQELNKVAGGLSFLVHQVFILERSLESKFLTEERDGQLHVPKAQYQRLRVSGRQVTTYERVITMRALTRSRSRK